MRINEVDLAGNAPTGQKNDPAVLMRNPQVAKMSQLAMQNFQGYVNNQIQRQKTQGQSAEITDQQFNDFLTNYTEQVLLKNVKEIPPNIKGNLNTVIRDITAQRNNATAMKQKFLELVANSTAARFSVTNVFSQSAKPKLKIKAGTVLNTENFGKVTFDGVNWKDEKGTIGREAAQQIMDLFGQ